MCVACHAYDEDGGDAFHNPSNPHHGAAPVFVQNNVYNETYQQQNNVLGVEILAQENVANVTLRAEEAVANVAVTMQEENIANVQNVENTANALYQGVMIQVRNQE